MRLARLEVLVSRVAGAVDDCYYIGFLTMAWVWLILASALLLLEFRECA